MCIKEFRCVLLDIEGTTTSISFVKDVLFPYVKNNIKTYIQANWQQPTTKLDIEALRKQAEIDGSNGTVGTIIIPNLSNTPTAEEIEAFHEAITQNVLWQMSLDRKTTALKQLQGHMWASAYLTKEVCGHVYDDVPVALEAWHEAGVKIYIYSSGSVEAQKLLFHHSIYGDLLKFIDGHFDTNIGKKSDPCSYKSIIESIGVSGCSMLFLTDVATEAYAAQEAGIPVKLVIREGNAPLNENDKKNFSCISSLLDLKLC